jgi:hypothetical protein
MKTYLRSRGVLLLVDRCAVTKREHILVVQALQRAAGGEAAKAVLS